jgi:hypothetical protein
MTTEASSSPSKRANLGIETVNDAKRIEARIHGSYELIVKRGSDQASTVSLRKP